MDKLRNLATLALAIGAAAAFAQDDSTSTTTASSGGIVVFQPKVGGAEIVYADAPRLGIESPVDSDAFWYAATGGRPPE